MKILRSIVIVVFAAVIFVPIVLFNWAPNSVSAIDNRVLTENPFTQPTTDDLTNDIENYVSDRIGLRDEMILAYTVLNDKTFGKMVHPSYTYGTDGYVFGEGITTSDSFSDYHVAFADMVLALQTYCEERDVPFLFVFNPAKPAVLTEHLNSGINYDRTWVDRFFAELDSRGVNYVDNTVTLRDATANGAVVFNKKYDANHWNDLGAFYGTNAMLQALQTRLPSTHVNTLEEFTVGEQTMTSLPVSNFPINEQVPQMALKVPLTDLTDQYKPSLTMHPSYRTFGYYINEQRQAESSLAALVFQGSYMNVYGYKYLQNAFGEYAMVHDYQNVMDLPYYFNIFKPDCVIFEVAEYTFSNGYFSYETMKNIDYNKPLSAYADARKQTASKAAELTVSEGETLTEIVWKTDAEAECAWLLLGDEYDMKRTDGGYTATVKTEVYKRYADTLSIVSYADGILTRQ